jgi:hypothetical protein
MPLVAGASLGAYEIVAPIGAGGMGEPDRAFDIVGHRSALVRDRKKQK